MFIRIRSYVAKFVKRPEVKENLSREAIKKEWQNIVGAVNKSARDKSQALYVNQAGELVVRVKDHLWLQELTFYKEEIRKELAKTSSIKSIRMII
jgi:hypothetical protein